MALLIGVQSSTNLGLQEFESFLETFRYYYRDLITPEKVLGDMVFSEGGYAEAVRTLLKTAPEFPPEATKKRRKKRGKKWWLKILGVERCFSRLAGDFCIEKPRMLGNEAVGAMVQLTGICRILQALGAHPQGAETKMRNISFIRG